MNQRLTADLSVDKRHHNTELDQPEPTEEKLRAVLHGNRAHITRAQALGVKHMSHAIGLGIHGGISETQLAVDQKSPLGISPRLLLKTVGQGVQVCRFDPGAGRRTQVQQRLGLLPWYRLLFWRCQSADPRHIVHCVTVSLSG